MTFPLPTELRVALEALLADGRRKLLGLAGPPGAGKSTLAQAIVDALGGERAQVVPMDGFHLAQAELIRLGRAGRKGAPDTFDAAGYVALLRRLRAQEPAPASLLQAEASGADIVYAPTFCRELEEPVAGAIAVHPSTQLIVAEGNYLLLPDAPWNAVAPLLDQCWWVDVPDALRRERLLARHMQFGRSAQAAQAWEAATDEPNARRIAETWARADRVVNWGKPGG